MENITCTVIKDGKTYHSDLGGLRPLMKWLNEEPELLENAEVIDKVVGKASAMLLTYGKVRKIHGKLMSKPAHEFLTSHNIEHSWDVMVDYIKNIDKTDMCPMEKKVRDLKEAEEAFQTLKPIFIK